MHLGICVCMEQNQLPCTSLNGTNWTMSRVATRPVVLSSLSPLSASKTCQTLKLKETRSLLSKNAIAETKQYVQQSNFSTSISLKSAPPTPTMRIDSGRSDAFTRASFVSCRSVMTPSCHIPRELVLTFNNKMT